MVVLLMAAERAGLGSGVSVRRNNIWKENIVDARAAEVVTNRNTEMQLMPENEHTKNNTTMGPSRYEAIKTGYIEAGCFVHSTFASVAT
ncbi:unnamed protein product [Leptidea sinapis]|uniref:Uncharacterized protein n=1 Tax=Leptidea sinapis TaxID=189913 RepID=A0A5E4Q8P9_9NEOP|nr:unnamed protein product [Leptidea sinapis]